MPSATRYVMVLHDLVDAHTRRGTSTTQALVARIALRNLRMRASLETSSQNRMGKKGMEKRARTRLFGAVRLMVFTADKPADAVLLWEKNILP
jgi:hypothetical protein